MTESKTTDLRQNVNDVTRVVQRVVKEGIAIIIASIALLVSCATLYISGDKASKERASEIASKAENAQSASIRAEAKVDYELSATRAEMAKVKEEVELLELMVMKKETENE